MSEDKFTLTNAESTLFAEKFKDILEENTKEINLNSQITSAKVMEQFESIVDESDELEEDLPEEEQKKQSKEFINKLNNSDGIKNLLHDFLEEKHSTGFQGNFQIMHFFQQLSLVANNLSGNSVNLSSIKNSVQHFENSEDRYLAESMLSGAFFQILESKRPMERTALRELRKDYEKEFISRDKDKSGMEL